MILNETQAKNQSTITFDRVLEAAGRDSSGYAAYAGHSPGGLRTIDLVV